MKRRKILIFSHIYFPWIGGAEIAIQEITDRIEDVEFVMITGWRDRKLAKSEKIKNIQIERVGVGNFYLDQYLYPFLAPFKAYQLYRKYNFDIAWAMMPSQAGMAALFFKLFFSPHLDYILTDQSGDSDMFWKIRTFFWKPVFRMIYKKAKTIQVISQFLKQRALDMGAEERKVIVIPNGVDIEAFSHEISDSERREIRANLGINDTDKVIITTSRLVYKNAVDVLLLAFDRLIKKYQHTDVKLVIVGYGEEEKKLKEMVKKLSLRDKVIFTGRVKNQQIPYYLSIGDIYCRPSRSEGQGISFLEAMCAGLPIVTTPVGGIVDFIRDKETGIFVQVNNPKDLAEKLYLVLTDDKLRGKIINSAKKMVIENYNWDRIVSKMKRVLGG